MKIKKENYLVIQGWMITDLNLKGNELIVYAVIYGFSQDNQQFTGSHQYLADWCNSTRQGIIKNINSLLEKGLLEKEEIFINNVKFCRYKTLSPIVNLQDVNNVDRGSKQSSQGDVNKVDRGGKQSLHNNKDNTIDNNMVNNKESSSSSESRRKNYEIYKNQWNEIAEKCGLQQVKNITQNRIGAIKKLLQDYSKEEILENMKKIADYEFLLGKGKNQWKMSFDDFLKEEKFTRLLEGGYYDKYSKNKSNDSKQNKSNTTAEENEYAF